MASSALLKALAVTAELTQTQLSPDAVQVMATDLSEFPEPQVMGALTRCRKELQTRLTIAGVVLRLDDGRPGVEEAWAMLPKSEAETGVLTDEIAVAMGVALPLLPDEIAARMAFKEVYNAEITRARNEHKAVHWFASIGHDKTLREGPIVAAVAKGRLTSDQATRLLPGVTGIANAPRLAHEAAKMLCSPEETEAHLAKVRELLNGTKQ